MRPARPTRHYDPTLHGPRVLGPGFHERVFAIVRTVPVGRVTTFGDVARALGWARAARQVGRALSALPGAETDVPWHRVVLANGAVPCGPPQVTRLERDGVAVGASGNVTDFAQRRFTPAQVADEGDVDGDDDR